MTAAALADGVPLHTLLPAGTAAPGARWRVSATGHGGRTLGWSRPTEQVPGATAWDVDGTSVALEFRRQSDAQLPPHIARLAEAPSANAHQWSSVPMRPSQASFVSPPHR